MCFYIAIHRYVTTVLYNFSTIDNIVNAPGRRARTQNVLELKALFRDQRNNCDYPDRSHVEVRKNTEEGH